MYLKKVISNKTERKKLFVVGILKVTDEKIRVPEQDPDPVPDP
jgi:hypothetical protein